MNYLWPCLTFVWVSYLWEAYLQWRQVPNPLGSVCFCHSSNWVFLFCLQRRVYQTVSEVPHELSALIDQPTFTKSRHYQLDKNTFSLLHSLFKQIELVVSVMECCQGKGYIFKGEVP